MTTEPLLAFKAGRCTRREGTNFVDALPAKGTISLRSEDGLLHFRWQDRTTGNVEEDLILFPQDASFSKVTQAAGGRVYVLKFSSSNQRHFFWMQDASSTRDEEFANNVNRLLENLEEELVWNSASSSSAVPITSNAQQGASSSSNNALPPLSEEQLTHLRQLVSNMVTEPAQPQPTVSLRDVLTPENLIPLFTNHPELIPALFPHLPSDLPTPPSAEVLKQIISSPQFQGAVRNFDQALHTGLLGGLVRGLGLPEEAGTGVEPFLRAVQEQAQRESEESGGSGSGDQMETD